MEPSSWASGIEEYAGKQYVVLRNVHGIMAVYLICADDRLRACKHWPTEIPSEV
jgi:hypothetical protein